MNYQLELKQIVDFPRCRIYREFIQTLMKVPSWELLGHWYSRDARRVYYLNREIKEADRDSFTVCTPPDAPPLADHLARDKDHFYQNDEMIEEPLWLERLHELTPEQ